MPRACLSLMLLLALTHSVGCGQKESLIPVDQFPKALIGLETKTEAVFAAFEAGDPKAADQPIHEILGDFNLIDRLAEPAGLNEAQQAGLKQATRQLLDAYHDLHAPMHKAVFPEDFDFDPVRQRLFDGLKAVRDALPASYVAAMQTAKDVRDTGREAAAAAASYGPQTPETDPNVDASEEAGPRLGEAVEESTLDPAADPNLDDPNLDDPNLDNPILDNPSLDAGAAIATPAFRVAAGVSSARVAPLCPSVMLWDDASYDRAAERVSRVAHLVSKAPPDQRWVQLVPTLHARVRPDRTLEAYGTMLARNASWTSAANFKPASDALADRFRDAFASAIGQAVRRGLHVAVLPHVDPAGGPVAAWRNEYDFAPGEKIGIGSYESLLIEPLAAAIEAEATSDTRIDLALCGEMGRSLFGHPAEYLDLLTRLRERFSGNPRTAGVRLGVALNWSGVAGPGEARGVDRKAAAELFAGFDFIALSCYAPVGVEPSASDFRTATENFVAELRALLGELPAGKPLYYAEVGVGGGPETVTEMAAKPYAGQGFPDGDPWEDTGRREFRRGFHRALCDYLATGDIAKAFLWSEGPWDPQGIAELRFRDEAIAELIDTHNRRVAAGPSTEGIVD